MIAPPLTVVKVGGGLLGESPDLDRVAAALARRRRLGERLLVVVSALRGVTDQLDEAAAQALDPRAGGEMVATVLQRLRRRHRAMLAGRPGGEATWLVLAPILDGIERLLTGIRLTGELTERSRDLLLAHGERLAAPLVAAAITDAGADARPVNSEEAGLVATGPYRVGSADLARSTDGLAGLAHELHDRVLVLTGFYGVTSGGDVVLFGRGGSDYTAGIVAAGLRADALELWKDVAGFLTADPRAVPGASLVGELSFDEACELGYYGARILHPRCLDPLRGGATRVSVRAVGGAELAGTRLLERRERRAGAVAALAVRRGVAVARASGAAMVNQPGVAGRVLGALGDAGISVKALASSMTSVSCSLDESSAPAARAVLRQLVERGTARVESFHVETGAALVGVVGDGVADDAGVAARVLAVLARLGVRVALISHGPRDVGLSVAVPDAAVETALGALHEEFFGAAARARHAVPDALPEDAPRR